MIQMTGDGLVVSVGSDRLPRTHVEGIKKQLRVDCCAVGKFRSRVVQFLNMLSQLCDKIKHRANSTR